MGFPLPATLLVLGMAVERLFISQKAISGEPSRLAHMFIVEAAEAGGHHTATAKIAESLARITAIDHR